MNSYTKERLQLIKAEPIPARRKQLHVDFDGFLYVDVLPNGQKQWVARWFGIKGSNQRFQKTLGDFAALSYSQASRMEDAARFAA